MYKYLNSLAEGGFLMLIENQKVKMKWNPSNRKHYESIFDEYGNKKYHWRTSGVEFVVDVIDLSKNSKVEVDVQCDYCGEIIKKQWANLLKERAYNEIKKDCCRNCSGKKIRDRLGTLNEPNYIDVDSTLSHYTKETLINEFYRYFEEFGYYPKLIDLKTTEGYPGATPYNKHWGNYSVFLKELNILGNDGWYKKDEETFEELYLRGANIHAINLSLIEKRSRYELNKKIEAMNLPFKELFIKREYSNRPIVELLTEALIDLYNDIGKIPVSMDFDYYTKLNGLPSRRKLEKTTGRRFSEFCLELFSDVNKTNKSDEELINDLVALKAKLGRTPMAKELKSHGLAEMKTYTRRFNMKYSELIESLGWELHSTKLKFKSEEELLEDFHQLYNELGRIPSIQEINDCEYTASYRTYQKYFESIFNLLELLEIEVPDNQKMSAGFVGRNKRNERCRSTQEIIISNMLIDSKIEYVPEVKYSAFDNKLKNNYKMDWYLKDLDIYVEYFGMFNERQLERNTRIGKYSRKVVKKIKYCNDNKIHLLDLYKSDLKNNYEGLVRKFKEFNIDIKIT